MKMKNKIVLLACIVFIFPVAGYCQATLEKFASFNNKRISYMGRVGITDSCAEIYWTGSSVKINVKQTTVVKALLADEKGNNYYYVIVDGDGANAVKIKVDKEKKLYTLAANLSKEKHSIELFKVTNTDYITTRFYGFETDAAAKVLKADKKPIRKIEFFGNSITCEIGRAHV